MLGPIGGFGTCTSAPGQPGRARPGGRPLPLLVRPAALCTQWLPVFIHQGALHLQPAFPALLPEVHTRLNSELLGQSALLGDSSGRALAGRGLAAVACRCLGGVGGGEGHHNPCPGDDDLFKVLAAAVERQLAGVAAVVSLATTVATRDVRALLMPNSGRSSRLAFSRGLPAPPAASFAVQSPASTPASTRCWRLHSK